MLEVGQKVEYLYEGEWRKGHIHGVKTHEEPSGIVTRGAYLIDTGKTEREDVAEVNRRTGKVLKTNRQPEQVELDQDLVRPLKAKV